MLIPPASRRSSTTIMAGARRRASPTGRSPAPTLIELPVTTVELAGRRFAAGGGGFFRLLPYRFSSWAIDRVNDAEGRPAVFYFHPWEIDPGQPRVAGAPLKSRLRHYSRLSAMRPKLLKLFKSHAWGRTDEVVERERERLS